MRMSKKKKKFAIWAYAVGLPFNAVRDENFQDVVNAIGDYGRGMPAPSYHNLRVTLLNDVLEDTKTFVDSFRPQWQKYRCSIMSDFWTDGKGRCLINFLVNCPTGTVFLKSIDASEHVKDAQLIVKMINEVIEDVGEENIVQTRWTDQLHHPLHAAGFFLNPAIFHGENSEIEKNKEIMTGLYVAIDRLVPDEDENDTLRQQLNLYIDSEGQFGSAAAKRSITKLAPYIWWRSYGIDTPLLQKFAITVLSQTCSASPCERNWSAFDNLHSKKRNCLLQQKLNDLVFIQYNTRLQRRFDSLKNNKIDPILLRDVEENDEWTIPTEAELQDFVNERDGLLWSAVRARGGNVDTGPTTRSKRERYRDDDYDIRDQVEDLDVGDDLDGEVNALDDVGSDAEPVDCN
ncbi:hypothetical protein L1887_40029 [Cichorium endivia]|nr:hypothetical protein L1887_40029 [Cichorium endivia]